MANQEHLDILKQGVEVWNKWRRDHLNDLIELDLSDVDLSGAYLKQVILAGVNLDRANLRGADLEGSNLIVADFKGANFSGANLVGALLTGADLTGAIFSGTDLINANLRNATLFDADFTDAVLADTIFGNVDLSTAKGLERTDQRGPSTIGLDTIYASRGNIPEIFLKGAGVDDIFITYIRSLVGKAIEYYSCFISYSSKDDAFARRLYADLQGNNVRCWFAPEDLKWGERIHMGIDEAIHMHDKLLLILSKHSVASGWVEREVKTALAKEKKEKRTVLFPVRVDRAVFDCLFEWATEIRHERNIGDFTRWKNHDAYEKAFARLLRDLKTETLTPP